MAVAAPSTIRKSQKAAQGLCADRFRVIIYGEEDHPEVMGALDDVVAGLEKLAEMLHAKERRVRRLPLSNLVNA